MVKLIDEIHKEETLPSLSKLQLMLVDFNAADKRGNTPLMLYCEQGHTAEALFLIHQAEAPINAQDKFGYTALMKAVGAGNIAIISELLKHKALIDLKNVYGGTALSSAIHHRNKEIACYLIGRGANLEKAIHQNRTLNYLAHEMGISLNQKKQVIIAAHALPMPCDSHIRE